MQPLELLHRPKPFGSTQLCNNRVLAALIVGGGAKVTGRGTLKLNAVYVAVEAQVKIKAGLLAVRDDIESRGILIMERGDNRIFLKLSEIVRAEFFEIRRSKLQPTRKRIAPDNRGAKRIAFHDF